jgi:hypothetical protein
MKGFVDQNSAVLLFDPRRFDPRGDTGPMIYREQASRLAVKLSVCVAVAAGCAFVGCSGDYGSLPSNKETVKQALNNAGDANQGANQGKRGSKKVVTKSIKQKVLNARETE